MKKLIALLALLVPLVAAAETRVAVYDNAKVYLTDEACTTFPEAKGLFQGRAEFTKDKKTVPLCWTQEGGAVWIVLENGLITVEEAKRFKPLTTI